MIRPIIFSALLALASHAPAQPVFGPLAGAPYSATARVHPEATKFFTPMYEGTGDTFAAQAASIFRQLADDLKALDLGPEAVVNVRGYLRVDADGSLGTRMGEWSDAFSAAFAEAPFPPTRTTLGSLAFPSSETLLVVDCAVAGPPGLFATAAAEPANPRLARLPSGWSAVAPFTPLVLTSGVLADAVTEGSSDFGPVERQTGNVLDKLTGTLQHWGLGARDVVFVRALLSPPAETEDPHPAIDFDGFEAGWDAFWAARRVPAPPVSILTGPGFNRTGRHVELEFYAASPEALGPFQGEHGAAVILREGSETSFLSRSVMLSRDASLIWFAGAIDRTREDMQGQGVNALLTLQERARAAGIGFDEIAMLRAYPVIAGPFRPAFGEWNEAYGRFFNHPGLNAIRPVRTAFPLPALPADRLIEVELIGATRE